MKTFLNRFRQNRRGNAMVEFAIGAGLLSTIFAGTFAWGFSFFRYNQLLAQVNAGARYGALRNYDSQNATPSTAYSNAVKNMVVYGTPSPADNATPAVPGLSTDKVNLTVTFTLGVPSAVTVSISNYTVNGIFRSVTLNGKPKVRYSFQSLWNPVAGGA